MMDNEYIITIRQLATVIKKCNGWPLSDKDGNPLVNPLEIDRNEVIELHEIVRCKDCRFKDEPWNCMGAYQNEPDDFCSWGERRTNDPMETQD